MTAILDRIDCALEQGHTVYVHCWGGRGRTGTVVGCHFVRRGATGQDALLRLAELWKTVAKSAWKPTSPELAELWKTVAKSAWKPTSPETVQQRSFVLAWRTAGAR
jgi:hypothetical protein